MDNFDWEKYLNYYDDLKIIEYNKESAINHWVNNGKDENRIFFLKNDIYLYNDFDWEKYLYYYNDIKNIDNIINVKELAINHWINNGYIENRIYFKKEYTKCLNLDNIFNNVYIISVKNIKPHQIINYLDIKYFDKKNSINDILSDNIDFLKSLNLFNIEKYNKTNILFINNESISFDYLKYQRKTLNELFEKYSDYDIIDLSLNENNFYELINKEINVFKIDNKESILDCYYITNNGLKKILNNEDLNIGYYSRPIFNFTNKVNNLWNSYYKVTNYWDKIFCFNLGFDINKRKTMMKYCNLLNSSEEDFFHDGILGLNLPELETLIDMGIYNKKSHNKNISKGTMGLNITQSNIIKESLEKNYNYVLILEDDIYFNENYFLVLDNIFEKYKDIDILYLGNVNYECYRMDKIFDFVEEINYNYKIYKPKKDLLEKISIYGFFAVLLSKKALKILYERFTPINNISDILLLNIAYDIKDDFSDNENMTKTNNNLNTYFIDGNLFNVILDKPSLTYDDNNFNIIDNFKNNKSIQFLSKIKRLNFKIDNNYKIKIYIENGSKIIYPEIIKTIIDKFINYEIYDCIDNSCDIVIFCNYDNIELNEYNINIYIDEHGDEYRNNNLIDISIGDIKENIYNYNIYLPYLSDSLERALGFKSKNICLVNNNNEEIKQIDNIDFYIRDLDINVPDNTIKRYLSDYIRLDDNVVF